MDLTPGPLALLVVHGKFCLLMNKKVSAWVISMFGLMLLDNLSNSRYFSLLRVGKAVTADQAAPYSKNRDSLLHSSSVNILISTSTVVVQEALGKA